MLYFLDCTIPFLFQYAVFDRILIYYTSTIEYLFPVWRSVFLFSFVNNFFLWKKVNRKQWDKFTEFLFYFSRIRKKHHHIFSTFVFWSIRPESWPSLFLFSFLCFFHVRFLFVFTSGFPFFAYVLLSSTFDIRFLFVLFFFLFPCYVSSFYSFFVWSPILFFSDFV